jgi:hypothetical protein
MIDYRIDGVPLALCSTETLRREWEDGTFLENQDGLSKEQTERLNAIEYELFNREPVESE